MIETLNWEPPTDWPSIKTIESHTGGEPLRVIIDGLPDIEGETILEKRRYFKENHDNLRRALMLEPRGHADMYGAIPVEPEKEESDLGVLFTHNEGYSTMCGHGIIALTTVLFETGILDLDTEQPKVQMDTPAGPVVARAKTNDDSVESVVFENVPSFAYALDRSVEVPGVGEITYDVGFGGAFYAYCDATEAGVGLDTDDVNDLIRIGKAIKRAVSEDLHIEHPHHEEMSFLYGTIFTGSPKENADIRNVCVFADGEVDRSPTGTGVSGHLALRAARSQLDQGEPLTVESVVGSTFTGRIRDRTSYGNYEAVIPEVQGSAHIVGRNEFLIDPDDPFADGFVLR